MRQLERYVLVEILRIFGVLITISTLLFVFVGVFSEAQKLDLGIWQVLQIMPYFIPSLMPYTIPATLLLTVCVVYGRMAGENEIIAVRAAGVHVMHLMWPAFFVAATLSLIALILSDQVTPWAFRKIERIVALAVEDIFLDKLRGENQITSKDHGFAIAVTGVRGRTLLQPTIRFTPRGGKQTTITAKEAHIEFDLPKGQVWLTLIGMRGNFAGPNRTSFMKYQRIAYELPKPSDSVGLRVQRTQDLVKSIEAQHKADLEVRQRQAVEAAFAMTRGDFDCLSDPKFKSHESFFHSIRERIRYLRTEYHSRIAMSVSTFFVVLLGTPFAILIAKKHIVTSFLFCFLPILTIYYPISMLTQNMSKSGQLDPTWASWVANSVLSIGAIYNLRRVMQN